MNGTRLVTITAALVLAFVVLGPALPCQAQGGGTRQLDAVPRRLGGIVLGADIAGFQSLCYEDSHTALRDEQHLTECSLRPDAIPGVRGGEIAYGNCARPGAVARIKLKLANDSREVFDQLLARYKRAFGKPTEWRGDPFHNHMVWKWSLEDKTDARISLVLSYSREADQSPGNRIKLTLRSLWDEEYACHAAKYPHQHGETAPTPLNDYTPFVPSP